MSLRLCRYLSAYRATFPQREIRFLSTDLKMAESRPRKLQESPIASKARIPDGMDGLIDGMDNLNESLVFASTKISDILQSKDDALRAQGLAARLPIVFVTEDQTVFDAIKLMTEKKIGAVLVRSSTPSAEFIGICTERDYMNKVALNGLSSRSTKVGQIMTRNPIFVRTDDTCFGALKKMTKGKFRHMPVIHEGKVVGILSLGDLVNNLISSFKDSVDYLSEYIGGTGVAGQDETFRETQKYQ